MIDIDNKLNKIKTVINSEISSLDKYKQLSKVLFERSSKKTIIENWQIEWMSELRREEYSYEDIAKICGLSMSSVRYYIVPGEKEKMKKVNQKFRKKMKSNATAWKAYQTYQREYQRKLAKKREESEKINKPNENENENDKGLEQRESA
jgi:predicted transcriptional regulator